MISPLFGLALSADARNVQQLARCYGDWRGIRTNHVVSSNGAFFDEHGSSRGISTVEDRELLLELRKMAELVLVDAKTATNEGYRAPVGRKLGVISRSGSFEGMGHLRNHPSVFFFTASENQEENLIAVSEQNPFEAISAWASSNRITRLLLEAGPTLTGIAFHSGFVTQAALTVTPNVPKEKISLPFASNLTLASLAQGDGATFSLWS